MNRYIDADVLIEQTEMRYCSTCERTPKPVICKSCWVDDMQGEIEDAPPADVVPVVHAYWIVHGTALVEGYRKCYVTLVNCSHCEHQMFIDDYHDYCPNCGAKMDLKLKDGENQ